MDDHPIALRQRASFAGIVLGVTVSQTCTYCWVAGERGLSDVPGGVGGTAE
jgi:hypothetical protein